MNVAQGDCVGFNTRKEKLNYDQAAGLAQCCKIPNVRQNHYEGKKINFHKKWFRMFNRLLIYNI